jgi:hypothetical protein
VVEYIFARSEETGRKDNFSKFPYELGPHNYQMTEIFALPGVCYYNND